ncbi:MAG: hypothetical protein IKH78_09720 [Ruminococcus sp.]|nr:hypothetical protein [Ruminococcus sp.]MBR6968795.1 hypothetical protein [Ruminococcus sp.]
MRLSTITDTAFKEFSLVLADVLTPVYRGGELMLRFLGETVSSARMYPADTQVKHIT